MPDHILQEYSKVRDVEFFQASDVCADRHGDMLCSFQHQKRAGGMSVHAGQRVYPLSIKGWMKDIDIHRSHHQVLGLLLVILNTISYPPKKTCCLYHFYHGSTLCVHITTGRSGQREAWLSLYCSSSIHMGPGSPSGKSRC